MRTAAGAALAIAAGGLLLTLLETLLPRSGVRTAAKVALGLLFLDLLAEQILRIIH